MYIWALENALLAKKYPGWIVRLYVSNDTIPSVIQKQTIG